VHAAAVDTHHRLREEADAQPHLGGHLATDELIKLDVVRCRHDFRVAVIDLELRGRDFGVVLFVLETHGALNFRRRVDELPQRVARQRVVVAAGVDVLELACLVIAPLGVGALEQKAFNLVGGVQRVAALIELRLREALQDPANIRRIWRPILIDHFAKHQHLARAEVVGGRPVERAPVHVQAQVTFALRRDPRIEDRRK